MVFILGKINDSMNQYWEGERERERETDREREERESCTLGISEGRHY